MLKWFLDPEGNKLEVKDCLKKGLLAEYYPTNYLRLIAEERPWTGKPSTTQLLNGTRMEYLKLFTPYAIEPQDAAFRTHGTKTHTELEKFTITADIVEQKIDHREITGTLDLIEDHNDELWMTDYKTWGSFRVVKFLGIVSEKRPAFDNNGNPILYQRDSKYGKKGQQKLENHFLRDHSQKDTFDIDMQLNNYRILFEEHYQKIIHRLKVFIIVRDGHTFTARNRGIEKNIYYEDVQMLNNDFVINYFEEKRIKLVDAVEGYKKHIFDKTVDVLFIQDNLDYVLLENICPQRCSNQETWGDRRCDGYCPVSEICHQIGDK